MSTVIGFEKDKRHLIGADYEDHDRRNFQKYRSTHGAGNPDMCTTESIPDTTCANSPNGNIARVVKGYDAHGFAIFDRSLDCSRARSVHIHR